MNEKRVARICWNTNYWQKPSGIFGKSKSNESHEGVHGYGGEEWLFDYDRMLEGYQYGFLEPINKSHGKYIGKTFDIGLYAIDGVSKIRYWIGEIQNVVIIDEMEREEINQKYRLNGWLDEMITELKEAGIAELGESKGNIPMNIKFRQKDVKIWDTPLEIDKNEQIYLASRYTLLTEKYYPEFGKNQKVKGFVFSPSEPQNPLPTREYERLAKRVESNNIHKEICKGLYKVLIKEWGKKNIGCEQNIGNGCRVDMVIKKQDTYSFIEIKTYTHLRYSIRMAIGQLLEYAYWIDDKEVTEFIIVGFQTIENEEIEYLKRLREKVKLNIYYWQFIEGKLIKN